MFRAESWMRLAEWMIDADRADWIEAMRAELRVIDSTSERTRFARGCTLAVARIGSPNSFPLRPLVVASGNVYIEHGFAQGGMGRI